MFCEEEVKVDNIIKDTMLFTKEVARFDWHSFLRLLIIIVIVVLICYSFLYIYYKFFLKKKECDNNLVDVLGEIKILIDTINKILDFNEEIVNKVISRISVERLKIIIKRYVFGFLYFCLDSKNIQDIEREFDKMLVDIARETIDANTFINYIDFTEYLNKLTQEFNNNTIKQNFYKLEKELNSLIEKALKKTITECKNANYIIDYGG